MKIRRAIVGHDAAGRSIVLEDRDAPRVVDFTSLPGFTSGLLWATEGTPSVDVTTDTTMAIRSFVPAPGGTRLVMVKFPPDSVMGRADFDAAAFGAECLRESPGLAETFELDHPGMHTTDTIDYDIVLEGEITLELDDKREVLLRRHDVAVQHGTRHAWRNRSNQPATMLFVLIGATRGR
ncbi:MAG: cupin domain-containing protein [Methylophilaceae bacterium]|uniref:cupin domain-containing protein n=1 Tax=Methylibium sp. TaxID=2067992 RepID=UPI00359A0BCE